MPTPKRARDVTQKMIADHTEKAKKLDLSTPESRLVAATNIANVYDATPDHLKQEGREWYPKVHEATAKGVRGKNLSIKQGAGLVAAVSPNMDWENSNIGAFDELSKLNGRQWKAIHKSHADAQIAKARGEKPHRSDEAASILQGMSISRAPDSNLIKAHRIMDGEDVDSVLSRRTAPKTNSFAHNIAEPDKAGHVTIDGRAHDIAANRMQSWTSDRGISSAATKSGKPTRYEHFEESYRHAANAVGELPHTMQAVTWVGGKAMEMATPTKSGKPRQKGPTRVGQPYV